MKRSGKNVDWMGPDSKYITPYVNVSKSKKEHFSSSISQPSSSAYPSMFVLFQHLMPILNQGPLNTCFEHALANAMFWNSNSTFFPSRDFLYCIIGLASTTLNAIQSDGTLKITTVNNFLYAINNWGICPECMIPYNSVLQSFYTGGACSSLRDLTQLPPNAVKVAKNFNFNNVMLMQKIAGPAMGIQRPWDQTTLDNIKDALMNYGPVIINIELPNELDIRGYIWDSQAPAYLNPNWNGDCHFVILIGWDDRTAMFTFQNSWGTKWGQNGIGHMTYSFVQNCASLATVVTSQPLSPPKGAPTTNCILSQPYPLTQAF